MEPRIRGSGTRPDLWGNMIGYRGIRLISFTGALAGSALAGFLGAGAAQAQERGEFLRDSLSTLGLVERQQDPIEYRERAPLVMPPRMDGKSLPAPRARTASPQWPREPEVAARQRAAEERRAPKGNQVQGRYNDNNATLTVDEIRSGRRADANLTREAERKPGDNNRDSFWVNPLDLMRGVSDEKTEPSVAEPDRDALTDPPNGYRKAPKKVAHSNSDPINNASREKEESDPGAYQRSQLRQ